MARSAGKSTSYRSDQDPPECRLRLSTKMTDFVSPKTQVGRLPYVHSGNSSSPLSRSDCPPPLHLSSNEFLDDSVEGADSNELLDSVSDRRRERQYISDVQSSVSGRVMFMVATVKVDKISVMCRLLLELRDGKLDAKKLMLRSFQYEELQRATNNFSKDCLVGTGAFGNVYRGVFDLQEILAIKMLHPAAACTTTEEFRNG